MRVEGFRPLAPTRRVNADAAANSLRRYGLDAKVYAADAFHVVYSQTEDVQQQIERRRRRLGPPPSEIE